MCIHLLINLYLTSLFIIILNYYIIGGVLTFMKEPVVHKPTHRAHNSPKRSRAQPHATTSHAPPPETPTRTQPDRAAHRHAPTPAPPPPAPVVPAGPPPEASLLSLPAELSATQIGNMNFWVDQGCKVDGKNLKNIKGIFFFIYYFIFRCEVDCSCSNSVIRHFSFYAQAQDGMAFRRTCRSRQGSI